MSATFHYFDAYGRGERVRWVLLFTNTQFTDDRIAFDTWPSVKPTLAPEFQQIPVLEIDGHVLVQSLSIVRYLGRKNGLLPTDLFDLYQVESLVEEAYDIYTAYAQKFFSKDEEQVRKVFNETFPPLFSALQARLERNNGGNGFFVGDSVTVADIAIAQLVHDLYVNPAHQQHAGNTLEERFPKLKGHLDRVLAASEPLRNYLASRNASPI